MAISSRGLSYVGMRIGIRKSLIEDVELCGRKAKQIIFIIKKRTCAIIKMFKSHLITSKKTTYIIMPLICMTGN